MEMMMCDFIIKSYRVSFGLMLWKTRLFILITFCVEFTGLVYIFTYLNETN